MDDLSAAMGEAYERYAAQPVLARIAGGRPLVRGCGPLNSPVMIVGEAPGEKEELAGRPFVGPAGKLFQGMLGAAGVPWECCYVTNVLCWRPPANRDPYPYEVQAAYRRLEDEIAVVQPLAVIAAGSAAWRGLTRGEKGPFADARLRWHDLHGRRLLCVPHPSFLLHLRSGPERAAWEGRTREALAQLLPGGAA